MDGAQAAHLGAGSKRRAKASYTTTRRSEEEIGHAEIAQLSKAAGAQVTGIVGSHDPLAAVSDALNLLGFDEVILSTLPARLSRWLRLDLPHKVRALGVPVTQIVASDQVDASPMPAA